MTTPPLMNGTTRARALVLAIALGLGSSAAMAQSFENQDASEAIAGSEISVGDTTASERLDALLAAIERVPEVTDRIKVMSDTNSIEVVYLSDAITGEAPAELEQAITDNDERITGLQEALQASAIFYNALTSQDVNIPDVVAADIVDERDAIIYVRGVAPAAAAPEGGSEDPAPAETPAE
jgi:Fic family protein